MKKYAEYSFTLKQNKRFSCKYYIVDFPIYPHKSQRFVRAKLQKEDITIRHFQIAIPNGVKLNKQVQKEIEDLLMSYCEEYCQKERTDYESDFNKH